MKPRLVKRMVATLLMIIMLFAQALTALAETVTVVTYQSPEESAEQVTFTYQYWCGDPSKIGGSSEDDPYKIIRDKVDDTIEFSNDDADQILISAAEAGLKNNANYVLNAIYVGEQAEGEDANDVICTDVTDANSVSAKVAPDANKVIRLYYSPVKQNDYISDVTMFDYNVFDNSETVNIRCIEDSNNTSDIESTSESTTKWDYNNSNPTEFTSITIDGKELPTLNGQTEVYCWAWDTFTYDGSSYTDLALVKVTKERDGIWPFYYYEVTDIEPVSNNGYIVLRDSNGGTQTPGNVRIKDWDKNHRFAVTTTGGVKYTNVTWSSDKTFAISGGINSNYNGGNYLAMGSFGKAQSITLNVNKPGVGILNANNNNAYVDDNNDDGDKAIIPELVSGLSGANYNTLNMAQGIYEPGYFSNDYVVGKEIYDTRYKLNFKHIGDTYTLSSASDTIAGTTCQAITTWPTGEDYSLEKVFGVGGISSDFFPMDNVGERNNDQCYSGESHNCYFGMRYDFKFTIGDYIGPLKYSFAGDDDLWVFMDGQLVLDLGGMHSAYPTAAKYNDGKLENPQMTNATNPYEVNLWDFIIGKGNDPETTEFDRTKSHQITVLYMERGGYDSSCYMNFTLPNATAMGSVIQKPAQVEFVKVDSTDTSKALSGAEFKITKIKEDGTVDTTFGDNGSKATITDDNGKIKFNGIITGTYRLEETKAPNGYNMTSETWILTATVSGDGVVSATLTDSNGNAVSAITNEPFQYTGDSAKTATLVDWENRIYKLDLTAKAESVGSGALNGVTIVDEISEYFVLCDVNGNVITEIEGATVTVAESGKTVITWENQDVPLGATGLTHTVYVKAKDEFAGGNYVPTNGNYTVTFPDGTTSTQETPHVNVYSSIAVGEAEDTIFLGENLTTYFTEDDQLTVSGVVFDENGNIVSVTSADGKQYTDFTFVDVTVTWTDENGNEVSVEEIQAATPDTETKYFATVTVTPTATPEQAQAAAESMKNSDNNLYVVDTLEDTGTYTVYVVDGEIIVTKKIKKSDIYYNDGDPIFTFQIEKDGVTQTRMVRFSEEVVNGLKPDTAGFISLTVKFDDLEKGTYNVKELSTLNYKLYSKRVDSNNTNCGYDDSIAFAIGQMSITDSTTNLEATKGAAIYTNTVAIPDGDYDKDMVVNKVVINANGQVEIQPQTVPEQY